MSAKLGIIYMLDIYCQTNIRLLHIYVIKMGVGVLQK